MIRTMKRLSSMPVMMIFPAFLLLLPEMPVKAAPVPETEDYKVLQEIIALEFSDEKPREAGEIVSGVRTRINSSEKVMAVTFNVCGREGDFPDEAFLDFLEKEGIPATFFVSGFRIEKNPELVTRIASNPFFEIANLGLEEKSCTVNGDKVPEGKVPAKSVEEVFSEIEKNARQIEFLTGSLPRFFRSASFYYDDVAVGIARALGYEVVGSTGASDGAGPKEVCDFMLKGIPGSIASFPIARTNPQVSTMLGQTLRQLKSKGFRFVKLGDYPLE